MKQTWMVFLTMFALLAATQELSQAAFNSGSTGADGALVVSQNTQLQVPESGVFNFTTVMVNSGVTLTFKKNEQNTAVTILASGDALIAGTISLNGSNGNYIIPGYGGPGGFAGGSGGVISQTGRRGEGPGGGSGGVNTSNVHGGGCGGGGSSPGTGGKGSEFYPAAPAGSGGTTYGNDRIIPLIGGSGGGAGGGTNSYVGGAGGGGGGAILIASSGTLTVTGAIYANGGAGANGDHPVSAYYGTFYSGGGGAGGSGGAIRLIATTITGNGTIAASGGGGGRGWNWDSYYSQQFSAGGTGSKGRIRFEGSNITRTAATDPPMSLGYPYAVIPPNMPTLKIVSIGGVAVPEIPKGDFGSPDITLPFSAMNPVVVITQAENVPVDTQVTIKANPSVGNTASGTGTLTGTEASSTASISLNISTAYPSVITAYITFQLTAANFYINGEKVEKVQVATTMGGGSVTTYITASGKEIPAYM